MFTRSTRRIVPTSLLLLVAGAALAITSPSVTGGPTPTATVGVPYSSTFTASGGVTPYTFFLSSGSLPNGLNLNSSTGAVAGTPTTPGVFNFQAQVSDSNNPTITSTGAQHRVTSQSGTPLTNSAPVSFSITVTAAPSPTPVPASIWMAMLGLAGAGLFRMRQTRRV
jgi:hypothetical protein